MDEQSKGFRSAWFGGFKREDVMQYIEQTDSKYYAETEELRRQLTEAQSALGELREQNETLTEKNAELLERLGEMTLDTDKIRAQLDEIEKGFSLQTTEIEAQNSRAQELAAENDLKVGDILTLTHAGLDQQDDGTYIDTIPEKTAFAEVEIVGIFQCDGAADSADSPTAGKAVNHIYSDSHLLVNLQEQQADVFEGEIAFYIADPLELDTLLERVEAIQSIDWDNHILKENDFQYEQIAGQLQNLQNLAVALIALATALGIVILILILMVQIRGRIREAGIYLSVGKPKMEIIGQFVLEAWGLLIVGFLSAVLLWLFCSGPVNSLLFGTLAQGTGTAALQTGGGGANYLQPDLLHSCALLAGELAAVLLTVLAASGAILRLKPKEILTKMS